MRERSLSLVATIATSVTISCSDAAVEHVTAPTIAATPASPVANTYPSQIDILLSGATSTNIGIQITVNPYFEADYKTFVVDGHIHFQSANEVSAVVSGWLLNRNGFKINEGSAGVTYTRFGIPVARGDTSVTVRISTNNTTCGLIGKSSYRGGSAVKAYGAITLWSKTIEPTNGPDALQPACSPTPPEECEGPVTRVVGSASAIQASVRTTCEEIPIAPSGGDGPTEVCYIIWRELWMYDWTTRQYTLIGSWPIGVQCYQT